MTWFDLFALFGLMFFSLTIAGAGAISLFHLALLLHDRREERRRVS